MALSALRGIGKKVGGSAMSAGRAASKMGDNKMFPLLLAGVGAAGVASAIPGAALDAGNEAAFGNPEADKAFLGSRGLSPGTVLDSTIGDTGATAGTIAGGLIGAGAGAALGMGSSAALTDALKNTNIPEKFAENLPLVGRKKNTKLLIKKWNSLT